MTSTNNNLVFEPLAEDVLRVSGQDLSTLRQLAKRLRSDGVFLDVIDGGAVFDVVFDHLTRGHDQVQAQINNILAGSKDRLTTKKSTKTLNVLLGGDAGIDFNGVCSQLELTSHALAQTFNETEFIVEFIGFVPGFAYISGLPPIFKSIERLATPRQKVPSNSLGLAGGRLGTYALAGPGGWPIIGHVETALFSRESDDPFYLEAGDHVRIIAKLAQ